MTLEANKNYSPQKIRGITWPITAKNKQENERVRVGENVHLNVLSALTSDGWAIQKEENDTLITDNRKLTQQRIINRFDNDNDSLGAPGGSPGSRPSIDKERKI